MKKLLTSALALALMTGPAAAQQLTPLQQYLYGETGYAPPQLAQPVPQPYAYYYPTPAYPAATVATDSTNTGPYENMDEDTSVGPSSEDSSLRGLLTSSGN